MDVKRSYHIPSHVVDYYICSAIFLTTETPMEFRPTTVMNTIYFTKPFGVIFSPFRQGNWPMIEFDPAHSL